ncbi:hypothetical protein BCR35DRAFT_333667 [Leucosporidium creatinivorum]|uniref:Uncharacterized protein n=1 Tax=Leucosporidium creatinivorum TaxID=106004 RepID=A0A1Y2EPD5_9BASI|nr:hypothetical protein BCR35DRAFT_333667 [Leucosporidium creatinivorum]
MNHLYHSLSPLVLLASFLILLLSFLAPVPILHERVSLLKVEVDSTASSATKRWLAAPEAPIFTPSFHRMAKRSKTILARATNSTKKASASAGSSTSATHTLNFGPMGACSLPVPTNSNLTCTSPSFTPIFVDLVEAVGLSSTQQATLPDQFPLAPTALFLALLLNVLCLNSTLLSSLASHAPSKAGFLAKKQVTLRKAALGAGFVSLCIGLAAAICLRVQLAKVVKEWNALGSGVAELGTGFTQLWAGFALEAVSVLLLVAEDLTSR